MLIPLLIEAAIEGEAGRKERLITLVLPVAALALIATEPF